MKDAVIAEVFEALGEAGLSAVTVRKESGDRGTGVYIGLKVGAYTNEDGVEYWVYVGVTLTLC